MLENDSILHLTTMVNRKIKSKDKNSNRIYHQEKIQISYQGKSNNHCNLCF